MIHKANTLPCEGEWRLLSPLAHEGEPGPQPGRFGLIRALCCTKACTCLLLAAVLCACGGGGDSTAPTTPPTGPACQDTVTVQLYGDSTQVMAYQWGYLQAALDARFGSRVILINQAASGTSSAQLIAGTDGVNTPWPSTVAADIAIVNHGINGQDEPLEAYAADMLTFASYRGARMVVETANPIAAPYPSDAPRAEAARQAAKQAGVPVADVQAYVLGLPGWEAMLMDGIHPTHELAKLIAENVTAPALAPVIGSMLCR
jgi:lysophospholipase L1-like esterase